MKGCGDIVNIFYFDIKITINILVAKAKYIMINYYKKYSNKNVVSYDKNENNYLNYISLYDLRNQEKNI